MRFLTPLLLLTACATQAPPAPAAPPAVAERHCVRAVILQDNQPEEILVPDLPTCEQRLEAVVGGQQESRAAAMEWLDERSEEIEARLLRAEQAVKDFRASHGILSVSVTDRLEMLDKRASGDRRLSKLERDERLELERLAIEEAHLFAQVEQEEGLLAVIKEKRVTLLLSPPAQVLEPCAVCR